MKTHTSRWKIVRVTAAALVLVLFAITFSGFGGLLAFLPHLQFGPALASCFSAFSAGAPATVLVIALLTLLFGRVYCSVRCPFGTLQELIALPLRKRKLAVPNLPLLRYVIAGLVFGTLAAGWTGGLLLDPYSNFDRIIGAFLAGGFIPLVVIAALALWKRRIFCTALCPEGTVLELLAKISPFRLHFTSQCMKCGRCASACPVRAITLHGNGTPRPVNTALCIGCGACQEVCPASEKAMTVHEIEKQLTLPESVRQ